MQILALFSASVASYFFLFIERQKNSEYWVQFSWVFCSIATTAIAKKVILLDGKLFFACFVSSSCPISIVLMSVICSRNPWIFVNAFSGRSWRVNLRIFAASQFFFRWFKFKNSMILKLRAVIIYPHPLKYEIDNDGYSLIILAYRNPRDLDNCMWK